MAVCKFRLGLPSEVKFSTSEPEAVLKLAASGLRYPGPYCAWLTARDIGPVQCTCPGATYESCTDPDVVDGRSPLTPSSL